MGVELEELARPVHGTPPIRPALENGYQSFRNFSRGLFQCSRTMRERRGDLQRIAETMIETQQRSVDHVSRGKPHRSAPIRIATFHARARFCRFITDLETALALS